MHTLCQRIAASVVTAQLLITVTAAGAQPDSDPPGGTWLNVESGTASNLSSVYAETSSAFAVGANGTLVSFDGRRWMTIPSSTSFGLSSVTRFLGRGIIAVGDAGIMLRLGSAGIERLPFVTSRNLNAVAAIGSDRLFAVGDNGTILQWIVNRFDPMSAPTVHRLRAVGGAPQGPVYAVGDNGTILRFDGRAWTRMFSGTASALNGVIAFGSDDAFAVGNAGTVLRLTGGAWSRMDTPTMRNLNAVWGNSPSRVFAVGDAGTILFFDGSSWRPVESGTSLALRAIHNGLIVGQNGTVLQHIQPSPPIDGLRITEVSPVAGAVEITNTGPAFAAGQPPLCYRGTCTSAVVAATFLAPGDIEVLRVPGLDKRDSDLWLYRNDAFDDASNIVHGVKYGDRPGVGRTDEAALAGVWPGADAFAPAPPSETSLAYDGFGFDPKDWYVDETPSIGAPDESPRGIFVSSLPVPGTESFENLRLGDEITVTRGWQLSSSSAVAGMFTARVVADVMGRTHPRGRSEHWLRIRDQDAGDEINNIYSPTITLDAESYAWTVHVNLEELPGDGPEYPRLVIQHSARRAPGFIDTWGLEFRANGAYSFVSVAGGRPALTLLFPYQAATGPGEWIEIRLSLGFDSGVLTTAVNGVDRLQVPIALADELRRDRFRLAYRGTGPGNVGTMLVDDITLIVASPFREVAFTAVNASPSSRGVDIGWDVSYGEPITGFRILREAEGGEWKELTATPLSPDTRSYRDELVQSNATYEYVIAAVTDDGREVRSNVRRVTTPLLAAGTSGTRPHLYVSQAHPNPFISVTTLQLELTAPATVQLEVFDVLGRRVSTITSGHRSPGTHVVQWNGRDSFGTPVSAGTYFVRVRALDQEVTRKLVLIR